MDAPFSSKPVYCDSTALKPQKCKDKTPCSPQYLDCVTKGPTRCICPSADSPAFMADSNQFKWEQPSSMQPTEVRHHTKQHLSLTYMQPAYP
jgi:hypothetical protein